MATSCSSILKYLVLVTFSKLFFLASEVENVSASEVILSERGRKVRLS